MAKGKGGMTGISKFVAMMQQPSPEIISGDGTEVEEKKVAVQVSEANGVQENGQLAQKTDINPSAEEDDATSLVPHYTHAEQLPQYLRKYFAQRYTFFSLYSTPPGCLLDEEGWYSVTPELIADQIAKRCQCDTVLDAFCGVGGNSIAFAKTCKRVIAMDISPVRLALAKHNAQIYGVADRIEFVLGDYIAYAKEYGTKPDTEKIDAVFLSPPWGGPSYIDGFSKEPPVAKPVGVHPPYSLNSIRPIDGFELFRLTRKITRDVAYFLPKNTIVEEIASLVSASITDETAVDEKIEIEEEWMGDELKALTCYFGGLAQGPEDMFEGEAA